MSNENSASQQRVNGLEPALSQGITGMEPELSGLRAKALALQTPHILHSDDEPSLRRVASYLDDAMASVEQRTRTSDSFDVALLTALNLARELVELRESAQGIPLGGSEAQLRSLIELAESVVQPEAG